MKAHSIRLFKIFLHFLAIFLIYLFLKPVFSWYLDKLPILGIDLYYTATYVAYHLKNLSFPVNAFKDVWFGGYPLFFDIFQLPFYLMTPLSSYFGLIEGIQISVLVSLLGLGIASYFLFYALSRNWALALVLSLLVLYSPNIYGAATWGGSLPYFAAQLIFPLVVLFLWLYKESGKKRFFWIASFFTGVGALTHPLPVISFVFPAAFFILFFSFGEKPYGFLRRLGEFVVFVLITILAGLRLFYFPLTTYINGFLRGDIFGIFIPAKGNVGLAEQQTAPGIGEFYRSLPRLLFTDTQQPLFYLVVAGIAVFILALFFGDIKKKLGQTIPIFLLVAYLAINTYANAYGYAFFAQGWYRQFWPFPIAIGALAAVLWGGFFGVLIDRFKGVKKHLGLGIYLVISAAIIFAGYIYLRKESSKTIARIEETSEVSSAFPEVLSIKFKNDELDKLKSELVPSFLDPDDQNRRLYTADSTVNIWWNALFNMPLARGYIDPPIAASERGGIFWLDIAIANDSLVNDFGVSPEIAFNNALFLIDWNAISFFEGGRLSSKGPNPPPSSYLLENDVFDKEEEITTYGAILKYLTESEKPELHMDIPQHLRYYKVVEEFTSPVLYATNAPVVLFFSERPVYEDFMRLLAFDNLNSRYLIPVYGGEYLDEFDLDSLSSFDAVFLNQYKYKNRGKTFSALEEYVKAGGKLFIDTGAEVKEANSVNLPEVLPIARSRREGTGTEWDLEVSKSALTEGVDVSTFGPLVFNEDEWKLSTPTSTSDIRDGSTVVLTHKERPILIERMLGEGRVVWSGMNLSYHFNQYKSDDEAELFLNILESFIPLEKGEVLSSKIEWVKPEKVLITTSEPARGILLKEQGYKGWSARANGKKLPIYLAGPTFPGFMYVPLGSLKDAPQKLEFKFVGEPRSWIITLVSLATFFFLIDMIVFDGRIVGKRLVKHTKKATKRVGSWWEKEEEY